MSAPAIPLELLAALPDLLMQACGEVNPENPLREKLARASGGLQYYVNCYLQTVKVEVQTS